MKRLTILVSAAMIMAIAIASCTAKDKVVENPIIEATNTSSIEISKVELTDTATILHIDAFYTPKYWIRIAGDSYLMADSKKYQITGGEGIEIDKEFWMPESGEASFILKFPPIPKETKSFDFIESDCEDCFKLYGIDLTGKSTYPKFPKGLPETLQKEYTASSLPNPKLEVGETTVNIHLMGFRKGMYKDLKLYLSSPIQFQKEYDALIDENTGIATFNLPLYGTSQGSLVGYRNLLGHLWLAPGENIDVYVDLQEEARLRKIYNHKQKDNSPRPKLYTTGTYADLNYLYNLEREKTAPYSLNMYNGKFADYKMSADEYANMVKSVYNANKDSINSLSNISGLTKEMALITLQQELLKSIVEGNYFLTHNYRSVHNKWDRKDKIDYPIAQLGDAQYSIVKELIDINNPKLLMGNRLSDFTYSLYGSNAIALEVLTNQLNGLANDIRVALPFPSKAENIDLKQEDLDKLKTLSNPFFAEACSAIQNKTQAQLDAIKDLPGLKETPNVSKEKLFDEIISKHKGKVIFVDFWNTWCGPCRSSIKQTEPLKAEELKSDDLVWIYIANETSPLVTYKTSIANIEGEHYRLNQEQWDYICDKFKIDGIPSYVLVTNDGKYGLRNDLRNHHTLTSTLKGLIQ